jgi:NADPH-dependent glutamate synthase beta subunit-like oxidoreductase
MRYGIPSYRLARSVLDGEIARIVALGIDVRCGESMETPEDFDRLRTGFDAVYLAIGARRQKRPPRLDYTRPWVMDGADYLARQRPAPRPPSAAYGGDRRRARASMSRAARARGHEVTILALESVSQMPRSARGCRSAEGRNCAGRRCTLTEAVDTGSAGLSLKCVRVRFEAGAARGPFTVTPVADSEFLLEADAIVPSIGQDPDLAPLSAALEADGALLKADQRQATSIERVYAGGDVSSMARFVTESIGMGKRAAREIDRGVARSADADVDFEAEPVVRLAAINTFIIPQARGSGSGSRRSASQSDSGWDRLRSRARAATDRCFPRHLHPVQNVLCPDLAVKREAIIMWS